MQPLLTTPQLKCIKLLVRKLQLTAREADIVHGYSAGRTEHVSELYKTEAAEVISYLKALDPDEKAADTMRKKIIALAHEQGWHHPGTRRIDMKRVDEWCKKYGYLHKSLDNYTLQELPKLVTQFQSMYIKKVKAQ